MNQRIVKIFSIPEKNLKGNEWKEWMENDGRRERSDCTQFYDIY